MNAKTKNIYTKIFTEIKNFFKNLNIETKFVKIYTDFEKGLIISIKQIFGNNLIIMGCWFHYLKSIIFNLKHNKIYLKKYKNINNNLIYLLKFFPYIESSLKYNFFRCFKLFFIQNIQDLDIELNHKKNYVSLNSLFK